MRAAPILASLLLALAAPAAVRALPDPCPKCEPARPHDDPPAAAPAPAPAHGTAPAGDPVRGDVGDRVHRRGDP